MKKPFTRRRPFSKPRSGSPEPSLSGESLPVESLDKVSYFETMRAYGGRVFALESHCRRLAESCLGAGRPLPVAVSDLSAWIRLSLDESGFADAVVRVSAHWSGEREGEFRLLARPFAGHPREWYERGVALRTAATRRPYPRAQDAQIKSSQFVAGVLAYVEGPDARPHEFLFLNPDGLVAEGSVSNLFLVKGKTLLTPPAASGILRGVTRQAVLESARRAGVAARETPFTRHDVYSADECFLTNTSSEVLPVVELDARRIGAGVPGPVTRMIAGAFKQTVKESFSHATRKKSAR